MARDMWTHNGWAITAEEHRYGTSWDGVSPTGERVQARSYEGVLEAIEGASGGVL